MEAVGGYEKRIARFEKNLRVILKLQRGLAPDQNDPFFLRLIVPGVRPAGSTVRDNMLETE